MLNQVVSNVLTRPGCHRRAFVHELLESLLGIIHFEHQVVELNAVQFVGRVQSAILRVMHQIQPLPRLLINQTDNLLSGYGVPRVQVLETQVLGIELQ